MVYLSLAITNNPNAEKESKMFQSYYEAKGYEVFNPVTYFAGVKLSEFEIMMYELRILKACEMMVVLPYSIKSLGVKLEKAFCKKFNIPIEYGSNVETKTVRGFYCKNKNKTALRISQQFIDEIQETFNISTDKFFKSRKTHIQDLRHAIVRILRNDGIGYETIGKIMNKNYTTMIYSNNEVFDNLWAVDPEFRTNYEILLLRYNDLKYKYENLERFSGLGA